MSPKDIGEGKIRMACICGYIHYANPVPVAVALIPSTLDFPVETLDHERMRVDYKEGVVLVQRSRPPFVGKWCLPCGFIDQHERPRLAAIREAKEECGLDVATDKILCACNPMPGEINQITISYLCHKIGGELKAGDDAADARIFSWEELAAGTELADPTWGVKEDIVCFRSHRMLICNYFTGKFTN